MKYDSFVKVKRAFIKSYSRDNLNKINLLLDLTEYGGNVELYVDKEDDYYAPTEYINKEKGILITDEGEQWMNLTGDYEGESKIEG